MQIEADTSDPDPKHLFVHKTLTEFVYKTARANYLKICARCFFTATVQCTDVSQESTLSMLTYS